MMPFESIGGKTKAEAAAITPGHFGLRMITTPEYYGNERSAWWKWTPTEDTYLKVDAFKSATVTPGINGGSGFQGGRLILTYTRPDGGSSSYGTISSEGFGFMAVKNYTYYFQVTVEQPYSGTTYPPMWAVLRLSGGHEWSDWLQMPDKTHLKTHGYATQSAWISSNPGSQEAPSFSGSADYHVYISVAENHIGVLPRGDTRSWTAVQLAAYKGDHAEGTWAKYTGGEPWTPVVLNATDDGGWAVDHPNDTARTYFTTDQYDSFASARIPARGFSIFGALREHNRIAGWTATELNTFVQSELGDKATRLVSGVRQWDDPEGLGCAIPVGLKRRVVNGHAEYGWQSNYELTKPGATYSLSVMTATERTTPTNGPWFDEASRAEDQASYGPGSWSPRTWWKCAENGGDPRAGTTLVSGFPGGTAPINMPLTDITNQLTTAYAWEKARVLKGLTLVNDSLGAPLYGVSWYPAYFMYQVSPDWWGESPYPGQSTTGVSGGPFSPGSTSWEARSSALMVEHTITLRPQQFRVPIFAELEDVELPESSIGINFKQRRQRFSSIG